MQWLAIVFLSIFACITYGIIHDQITARICVEYFTIGHPPVFRTSDPTLLGFGWGVIATWWVGAMLGLPLATADRIGGRPKKTALSLIRPMVILFMANGLLATIAGVIGYLAASSGSVQLVGWLAERIPPEKQIPFLTDLWIHNASYLGGFIGGLLLIAYVWRTRIKNAQKNNENDLSYG